MIPGAFQTSYILGELVGVDCDVQHGLWDVGIQVRQARSELVYVLRQQLVRIRQKKQKKQASKRTEGERNKKRGKKKEKDLVRIADTRVQVWHFVVGKASEVLLVVVFSQPIYNIYIYIQYIHNNLLKYRLNEIALCFRSRLAQSQPLSTASSTLLPAVPREWMCTSIYIYIYVYIYIYMYIYINIYIYI